MHHLLTGSKTDWINIGKTKNTYYANYKADIPGSRVTYREIEEIQESGEEEP